MLGAEAQPKHITLPPARERSWLIEQTRALLERSGWQGYVRAPLLEPTPAFFPDHWGGGEASVRRVLLRLLRYAGHDGLDVSVQIHPADPARRAEVLAKPPVMRGRDPLAWYVGRDGSQLRFACEEVALREPENLVPGLARAVAHAHRVLRELPIPEGVEGQRLIDLTGFALGFGLLTTDATQRFYAKSAGGFRATRAESRLGALSTQDMCFLLALQLGARGLDRRRRRQLLARIQPNQAGFVREAAAWFETQPPIRDQLGIPEPSQWPGPVELAALTGPLVDPRRRAAARQPLGSGVYDQADEELEDEPLEDDEEVEERRDIDRGIRNANVGKPVFRIERSGALRMAKLLGFPILLIGALLSRGNFGVELPMEYVMPTAIGLAVLGLGIGSLFTDRRCSEPKCGHKLREDDETCPLCGGVVMGVLHSPKERLGAEEELTLKGKLDAQGMVVGWEPQEEEDDDEWEDEHEEEDKDEQSA